MNRTIKNSLSGLNSFRAALHFFFCMFCIPVFYGPFSDLKLFPEEAVVIKGRTDV